ncbi:MAG: hypothetical protein LBN07_00915 [Christensenellaceae bacterium]|jgi:hypothetical protein|nr:hypothetical protein [Christensenellaceae bacterium]
MAKAVKMTKQGLTALVVMIVLGAATGIFIGVWWVKNLAGGEMIDYSAYDPVYFRQQNGSLSLNYYQSFLTPSEGQLNKNNIQQLFLAAQRNSETANKYTLKSVGLVDTIAKQEIRGYKKYDASSTTGYKFYAESFSKGAKDVVELTHYNDLNQISVTLGSFTNKDRFEDFMSGTLGNYSGGESVTYAESEYADKYGLPITNLCPYIVSSATLIDKTADIETFKKITLNNGRVGYNFKLTLDRVYSVIEYATQMVTVSGLTDPPTFTQDIVLDITLTVLDDGKIVFYQTKIDEYYNMKFGAISPRCHATLTQTFDFISEVAMPAR